MKIIVSDWREGGKLFEKYSLPYEQGKEIEGDEADLFRIAQEIFSKGLNIMVSRLREGSGTRKSPLKESYLIAVDSFRFQQR